MKKCKAKGSKGHVDAEVEEDEEKEGITGPKYFDLQLK